MHESSRKNGGGHTLVRVDETGNEEPVGTFATFGEGWSQGQHRTHAEPTMAFSLYRPNGSRAARFGHHRLATKNATALLDTLVL